MIGAGASVNTCDDGSRDSTSGATGESLRALPHSTSKPLHAAVARPITVSDPRPVSSFLSLLYVGSPFDFVDLLFSPMGFSLFRWFPVSLAGYLGALSPFPFHYALCFDFLRSCLLPSRICSTLAFIRHKTNGVSPCTVVHPH